MNRLFRDIVPYQYFLPELSYKDHILNIVTFSRKHLNQPAKKNQAVVKLIPIEQLNKLERVNSLEVLVVTGKSSKQILEEVPSDQALQQVFSDAVQRIDQQQSLLGYYFPEIR